MSRLVYFGIDKFLNVILIVYRVDFNALPRELRLDIFVGSAGDEDLERPIRFGYQLPYHIDELPARVLRAFV